MTNRKIPALLDSGTMAAATKGSHSVTLSSDLIKDWNTQKEVMHRAAHAMPEYDFAFKPTPAQRSFAEQVVHTATVNVQLIKCLGGQFPAPLLPEAPTAKGDVIRMLDASYDYGAAVIRGFSNVLLLQPVAAPEPFQESTRARIVYLAIAHAQSIYGQLAVYLRLKNLIPPARS
jgi:hypothetical protein